MIYETRPVTSVLLSVFRCTICLYVFVSFVCVCNNMLVHGANNDVELKQRQKRGSTSATGAQTAQQCGHSRHSSADKGFIHTPNFPKQFPTPISCKWIFQIKEGKKIVFYFTQFFVKEAFRMEEYDYYSDVTDYVGLRDFGDLSADKYITIITSSKPFVVVYFAAPHIDNIHIRVEDYLLDVYGFNITYEIIDSVDQEKTACSVYGCSYLGTCLADAEYSHYQCHCFPGFFGNECQYGKHCDPDRGENMCENNGECRYQYGSRVNVCQCPLDYTGRKCEMKKTDYLSSECEKLDCSQYCDRVADGRYACSCYEGFTLYTDNKTCVDKGYQRFVITSYFEDNDTKQLLNNISETIYYNKMAELFKTRLKDFDKFTILETKKVADEISLKFTFTSVRKEERTIDHLVNVDMRRIPFSQHRINVSNVLLEIHPVFRFLKLEKFDKGSALDGKLLTMTCSAKGSEYISFEWSKNGAIIDVSKTHRNMWIVRIPNGANKLDNTYNSVLNIEKVHKLDAGQYGCRASDLGSSHFKTFVVNVVSRPRTNIDPISRTVYKGRQVVIKCISKDDTLGSYEYSWLRDNVPLVPSFNKEVVEELVPTGSRLTLHDAQGSALYTCIVRNQAGHSQINSSIAVMSGTTHLCFREELQGIAWNNLPGNHTDYQKCPDGTEGIAKRRCSCGNDGSSERCKWLEPNMANCVSNALTLIKTRMENIELGFVYDNITSVLDDIRGFLAHALRTNRSIYAGDLSLASRLLYEAEEHRQLYYNNDASNRLIKNYFNVSSLILNLTCEKTEEEIFETNVGEHLIRLTRDLGRTHPSEVTTSKPLSVLSSDMEILVQRMQNSEMRTTQPSPFHSKDISFEVDKSSFSGGQSGVFEVTAVVHKSIQRILPNDSFSFQNVQINSRIVYVNVEYEANHTLNYDIPVTIEMKHLNDFETSFHNMSMCAMWEFSEFPDGSWSTAHCTVLASNERRTRCRCRQPALIVVLTSFGNKVHKDQEKLAADLKLSLLIGCCVSITGFTATLFLFAAYKRIHQRRFLIPTNISLAMISINGLYISGLDFYENKEMCMFVALSMHLMFLAAMLFCMLDTAAPLTHITEFRDIFSSNCKLVTLGWGIPIVAVCVTVITSYLGGFNYGQQHSCWITFGNWQLYAFLGPLLTIITATGFITVVNYRSLFFGDQEFQWRKCDWQRVFRPLLTSLLLYSSCYLSIDVSTVKNTLREIILSCIFAVMGVVYFVLHFHHITKYGQDSPNTFKSFIKPQINQSKDQQLGIDDAYKHTKYTKERKDQLIALLGTSSTESEAISDNNCLLLRRNMVFYRSDLVVPKPARGRCYIICSPEDSGTSHDVISSRQKRGRSPSFDDSISVSPRTPKSVSLNPFPDLFSLTPSLSSIESVARIDDSVERNVHHNSDINCSSSQP